MELRNLVCVFMFLLVSLCSQAQDLDEISAEIDQAIIDGNFDRGISYMNGQIALFPEEASLYMYRSVMWLNLYNTEMALGDIDTAIAKSPYYDKFYFVKSLIYSHLHDYAKAFDCIEFALAISPNYKEFVIYKFTYLLHLKKYKEAYAVIYRLNQLYPKDPYVQSCLALGAIYALREDAALEHILMAYSINDKSSFVNNIYGLVYLQKNDFKRAQEHFLETVYSQEYELINFLNQAIVHLKNKDSIMFWENLKTMVLKSKTQPLVLKYKHSMKYHPDPLTFFGQEQFFSSLLRPWRSNYKEVLDFFETSKDSLEDYNLAQINLYSALICLYVGEADQAQKYIVQYKNFKPDILNKEYVDFLIHYYTQIKTSACSNLPSLQIDPEVTGVIQNLCR